ncbi:glycine N-acyltransferase-like [Bufo gargarizans]|uniref:glycine N-acyltransferase-like n=1 Tax=Bufo gargarizans TaxID=30331 RepID=UPI001CF32636|nr:glycine N-acyltransferase-like [Bufo gargarizans]
MTNALDPYNNTYFLFSKDPHKLSQMLEEPVTVNWRQKLQIQGCQPELGDVLQKISSRHGSYMKTTSNVLYMSHGIRSVNEVDNQSSRRAIHMHFSALNPHEAYLVNAEWGFGGNEHSKNYIKQCIQMLPTMCARKEAGEKPIAWVLSDQSAEIRMGYTEAIYRSQGVFNNLIARLGTTMISSGVPLYCHIAADNTKSQAACKAAGFFPVGRWEQWSFQPS